MKIKKTGKREKSRCFPGSHLSRPNSPCPFHLACWAKSTLPAQLRVSPHTQPQLSLTLARMDSRWHMGPVLQLHTPRSRLKPGAVSTGWVWAVSFDLVTELLAARNKLLRIRQGTGQVFPHRLRHNLHRYKCHDRPFPTHHHKTPSKPEGWSTPP